MTKTAKKLMEELEKLPDDEQEAWAASHLEELRLRTQHAEGKVAGEGTGELYEPFQLLQEANLDLPSDYSETYEQRLYGIESDN